MGSAGEHMTVQDNADDPAAVAMGQEIGAAQTDYKPHERCGQSKDSCTSESTFVWLDQRKPLGYCSVCKRAKYTSDGSQWYCKEDYPHAAERKSDGEPMCCQALPCTEID